MRVLKYLPAVILVMALGACEGGFDDHPDKSVDRGWNSHDLSDMEAGIWVDPNGCQHWIIDDGIEGYLSARLDASGRPVCSDALPPSVAIGDFKQGGGVADII